MAVKHTSNNTQITLWNQNKGTFERKQNQHYNDRYIIDIVSWLNENSCSNYLENFFNSIQNKLHSRTIFTIWKKKSTNWRRVNKRLHRLNALIALSPITEPYLRLLIVNKAGLW